MKVCHFCGAQNEDWMKICQECGNPVIDTAKRETKEEEKNENENEQNKEYYMFYNLYCSSLIFRLRCYVRCRRTSYR